ncbi:hypothetical protein CPB84DRAFT_1784224 [Gymnopilus junonius]|uniref:Uncharacterized protein n=1 Tax=Gymnopilus junonius TaxID=109634 RepID=A0A9P5NH88_GYMJU|nr:hypothetical protein CPB84DRAFT_1784224 [Gymnopilus junonius]
MCRLVCSLCEACGLLVCSNILKFCFHMRLHLKAGIFSVIMATNGIFRSRNKHR